MAVQGELFVNTDSLDDLGAFLSTLNTTLSENLDTLKTEFAKITTSWKDKDGAELNTKYESFITSAEELKTKIEALTNTASQASKDYITAQNKATSNML